MTSLALRAETIARSDATHRQKVEYLGLLAMERSCYVAALLVVFHAVVG
jgi:hypothetical protein